MKTPSQYLLVLKDFELYVLKEFSKFPLLDKAHVNITFTSMSSLQDLVRELRAVVALPDTYVVHIPYGSCIDRSLASLSYDPIPPNEGVYNTSYTSWVACQGHPGTLHWKPYPPKLSLLDFFKDYSFIDCDDCGHIWLYSSNEPEFPTNLYDEVLEVLGGCEAMHSFDQEGNLTLAPVAPPADTQVIVTVGNVARRMYSAGGLLNGQLQVYKDGLTKWASNGRVSPTTYTEWRIAEEDLK